MKYDVLWYLPHCKARVLAILNVPSVEERQARQVFGLRWGPGQPRPPAPDGEFKGPAADWNIVWGNFLGYEKDPDLLRKLCNLEEIGFGLIGGKFKTGALDTGRHRDRAEKQAADEAAQEAGVGAGRAATRVEYDRAAQNAIQKLLFLVARLHGVKKPQKWSFEQLCELYDVHLVTSDQFDADTMQEFVLAEAGEKPAESNEPITLENVGDWEKYMADAYGRVVAAPVMIKKPYKIEKIA